MKTLYRIFDIFVLAAAILFLYFITRDAHGSPIPFASRPGAPVAFYIDTSGFDAEAWFPGINVPALPPPAFTDAELQQILQYEATSLAGENINVTNVDPVKTLDPMGWSNSPGAVQAERIVLASTDFAFLTNSTPQTAGFNTSGGYYDPGTILHKPFGDPTGTLLPWDSHTGFSTDRFGIIQAEKSILHEFLAGMGVQETADPSDVMSHVLFPNDTPQTISAIDLAQLNSRVDEGGPQAIPEPTMGLVSLMAAWAIGRRPPTNKVTR